MANKKIKQEKPIVAIIYDFDKTLCDQDMQNYSFIPSLGMTPDEFWKETEEFGTGEGMEGVLAYLYTMVKKAKEKNINITRDFLRKCGEEVKLYKGVKEWFRRTKAYGEENDVIVEHYIISSGIKDIIQGTPIAKEFKEIFACDYYYDESGNVLWPKIAINFTLKTQYLYKINKGILDVSDSTKVNEKQAYKRIPFKHMIYIGDGLTDIPCMIMLKKQGGKSIGLYTEKTKSKVEQFFLDDRINYTCKADYSYGSKLDRIIRLFIKNASLTYQLDNEEEIQREEIGKERS